MQTIIEPAINPLAGMKIAEAPEKKDKSILILSGGMDSMTLLYELKDIFDIYAVSYDYGQRHKKELECARMLCKKLNISHKIVDIQSVNQVMEGSALTRSDIEVPEGHYQEESMKVTVVPNRNMIMLSIAIAYAVSLKATNVFFAAHAGDHAIYPDCRLEFVNAMNAVSQIANYHSVNVRAPYLHFSKGDIANLGKELGVDYSLTWSCYKGESKACGKCGACVERLEAFEEAGIKDPIEYV